MVKLVDEPAGAGVGMLGDLADERAVVQRVNLVELVVGLGALEDVTTDLQHPRCPPAQQGPSRLGEYEQRRPSASRCQQTLLQRVRLLTRRGVCKNFVPSGRGQTTFFR